MKAPDLNDHLCLGVYLANLEIQRTYKPLLDDLGLTYPQYLVLNLLWEKDGRGVSALANALGLEPSTITPVVKRLEGRGLVKRTRSAKDERQVHISLTEMGQALQSSAACVPFSLQEGSGYSVEEILELNRQVRRLQKALVLGRSTQE